ncbi:unnamed protein product [Effrenium voratum]|nr:unnamed protein product [Effrenium voratum]
MAQLPSAAAAILAAARAAAAAVPARAAAEQAVAKRLELQSSFERVEPDVQALLLRLRKPFVDVVPIDQVMTYLRGAVLRRGHKQVLSGSWQEMTELLQLARAALAVSMLPLPLCLMHKVAECVLPGELCGLLPKVQAHWSRVEQVRLKIRSCGGSGNVPLVAAAGPLSRAQRRKISKRLFKISRRRW